MAERAVREPRYVVAIGASAGGLQAITELMTHLHEPLDAAVLAVIHTPNIAYGDVIIDRIQRNTGFVCKMAEDEETIQSGHFYLAVPDHHLLVKDRKLALGRGAVENRWRPSIDALFRSAAVAYNSRAIGIVLTGLLEDGTTGMQFIKRCGGTCIVQDPTEAEYPDMPKSVLRFVQVDYCTKLERIATILQEMLRNGTPEPAPVPEEIAREAAIAERISIGMEDTKPLGGTMSPYSCPDCGGSLWEFNQDGLIRFRCYTGHAYTADELQESKRQELESSFWVALRILEERRNLLLKMSEEEEKKGWIASAANKARRADELQVHIGRIKEVLFSSTDDPEPNRLQLDQQ